MKTKRIISLYSAILRSLMILCFVLSYTNTIFAQQEIPRGRGIIYLDSVTATSLSIRWNKLSDASAYAVCAFFDNGQQRSTIITSDTTLTFRNLQPGSAYSIIIVVNTTCSVRPTQQTCYNDIAGTTLTPELQNFTYDSRFVPFNRNDTTGVPQLVDSTIFYRLNDVTLPMGNIEKLLVDLRRMQIPMDSVVVTEGYNGIGTPCRTVVSPVANGGTIILKMTRPLSESEKTSLRSMSIIPTSRILFGEFPTNSQLPATTTSIASQIQKRLYVFPRTTSARGTQQEPGLAVRISPQPLSGAGLLTLMVQRPIIADIRVVNMLGQIVATLAQGQLFSTGETTIPCSFEALSSGVYAVQVVSGGRILHTQNIVVTR
jgi:hypothetical protein